MTSQAPSAEISRLELLAELDDLVAELRSWSGSAPDWPPIARSRALIGRLLERTETLAAHLDAPLVVATFGGTGTGKSALVNALVGQEVTSPGRQRPTTRQPVLIGHSETDFESLGLPTDRLTVVRCDAPLLRELVLIDCPDPDTTETAPPDRTEARGRPGPSEARGWPDLSEARGWPGLSEAWPGTPPPAPPPPPDTAIPSGSERPGTHPSGPSLRPDPAAPPDTLGRLREVLPLCDVLLYTTTQQKYRSARVSDELLRAAAGCRIVFVQTHAALDSDIRDDWRRVLEAAYEVPDILFVDSLAALEEQRSGGRPTGDFRQLRDLLRRQGTGAARQRIRRANLIGLLEEALASCRQTIDRGLPAVRELESVLDEQHRRLVAAMSARLADELAHSRRLWESRLMGQITEAWGFSPFAAVLRLVNGLGGFVTGLGLLRARSGAQLALLGVFETGRQVSRAKKKRQAQQRFERLGALSVDETLVRDAQLIVDGYAADAQLARASRDASVESDPAGAAHRRMARLSGEFYADARRRVDDLIAELADRRGGAMARIYYETLFGGMLLFLLFRLGKNFFYDSLLGEPLLGLDFYVHALFWLVLWSAVLVMLLFTHRLRRGLKGRIDRLARELAASRLSTGPFPELSDACARIHAASGRLALLEGRVETLRTEIAEISDLGRAHASLETRTVAP